jgi:hypothetical protein
MFFEDVDLGWRLWLLGYEVRYVPASFVYHRHHGSMSTVGSWREHYLLERNALFTIYKNYDDENLRAVLPAALTLTIGRSVVRGGDDPHMLEVSKAVADEPTTAFVHKETLAGPFAVDAFLSELDDLTATRRELQGARRRADAEILPLFRLRTPVRCCGVRLRRRGQFPGSAADPRGHRRLTAAGHGRPRDPRLADRAGAVPGARRGAREHHEVRGPDAS